MKQYQRTFIFRITSFSLFLLTIYRTRWVMESVHYELLCMPLSTSLFISNNLYLYYQKTITQPIFSTCNSKLFIQPTDLTIFRGVLPRDWDSLNKLRWLIVCSSIMRLNNHVCKLLLKNVKPVNTTICKAVLPRNPLFQNYMWRVMAYHIINLIFSSLVKCSMHCCDV